MELSNSNYRRRVFMTLSQKPAKAGLRLLVTNTKAVNLFHAVLGISTETNETLGALSAYLSGASQLKDPLKVHACEEMGDSLYYVFVAAKVLKVKVPSLNKKIKLKGMTLTEALLKLNTLSGDMLDLQKKILYGPVLMDVEVPETKKPVAVPSADGTVVTSEKVIPAHTAQVLNKEAQEAKEAERNDKVAVLLAQYVELFWAICYSLFNEPPMYLAVGNAAKLATRYPKGYFDALDREDNDPESEIEAMTAATASASE